MTHRDRAGDASGQRAGRRSTRGPASVVVAGVLDDLSVVGQGHTFLLFLSGIIVP